MSNTLMYALEVAVFVLMCIVVLVLTVWACQNRPLMWQLFVIPHITFVVLSILALTTNHCDNEQIKTENVHGMRFISSKLLQAKYSPLPECYILPPMITANVCVLLVQTHLSVTMYTIDRTVNDVACYAAAIGMVSVILFDSQTVSGKDPRTHMHLIGVVFLTLGILTLHVSVLVAHHTARYDQLEAPSVYGCIEVLYVSAMIAFFATFLLEMDAAVPLEYMVLGCFELLSILNLTLLVEETRGPDQKHRPDNTLVLLMDTMQTSKLRLELLLIPALVAIWTLDVFMSYFSA